MSGHLADVTLGPKEWTSLILVLERKWEEPKPYNSTSYSVRKVASKKSSKTSLEIWSSQKQMWMILFCEFSDNSKQHVEGQYKLRLLQFALTLSLRVVVDNYLNWAEEHCFVVGNCRKGTSIHEISEKIYSIH